MTDVALPVDSRDLWDATFDLPTQVVAAVDAAQQVDDLPGHDEVENVVVLGMGDSGFVGDVLTAVDAAEDARLVAKADAGGAVATGRPAGS